MLGIGRKSTRKLMRHLDYQSPGNESGLDAVRQ
jgi:hypothetical protein